MPPWTPGNSRTLRDVVSDVWMDTSLLIQQHLELAAQEASERTSGLGLDLGLALAAVALLHAAVFGLLATAAFALHASGLAPWLAVGIVAVVSVLLGAGLALWAKSRIVRRTTTRSETLVALGETSDWIASALRGERS